MGQAQGGAGGGTKNTAEMAASGLTGKYRQKK